MSEVIYTVLAVTGGKHCPYRHHKWEVRVVKEDNPRDSALGAIQYALDKLRGELEPDMWLVSLGVDFRRIEE